MSGESKVEDKFIKTHLTYTWTYSYNDYKSVSKKVVVAL